MVAIGGQFAIDQAPRSPKLTLAAANGACTARNTSLCTSEQWYQACQAAPAALIQTRVNSGTGTGPGYGGASYSSGEWTSSIGHYYGVIMNAPPTAQSGGDPCASGGTDYVYETHFYRCCTDLK